MKIDAFQYIELLVTIQACQWDIPFCSKTLDNPVIIDRVNKQFAAVHCLSCSFCKHIKVGILQCYAGKKLLDIYLTNDCFNDLSDFEDGSRNDLREVCMEDS